MNRAYLDNYSIKKQGTPIPGLLYVVFDCSHEDPSWLSVAFAFMQDDKWYNHDKEPLSQYDWRDLNNNCGLGEVVTHFMDVSDLSSFFFQLMDKE